jgi:tRNA dimethylallyltransferase
MSTASLQYIVLTGPTGVGKSDLATEIAQTLGWEIIGADAFQIYAGLDILTAQPPPEHLSSVPHHLVGTLPLTDSCDAHRYAKLATGIIEKLNTGGHTPLVSGGTGFYLEALAGTLSNLPPADWTIRAELESYSLEELRMRLGRLDPLAAASIDGKNRRRLIRALEVCLSTERPFSSFRRPAAAVSGTPRFSLIRPRSDLYARIDCRVDQMFERGVAEEVKNVSQISPTASQAIGFRQIRALLEGKVSEKDCRDQIKQLTRNYAKRQQTWFRHHGYDPIGADQPAKKIIEILKAENSKI